MLSYRVILIDDHPIVLAGLADLVGQIPRFSVVATGRTAKDAVDLVARDKPDLVIMDLNMPGDVLDAVEKIATGPKAPVVVIFTASNLIEDCTAALNRGARGYVVKGSSGDEIFRAIDVAMQGGEYISSELAASMIRHMRKPAAKAMDAYALSLREEQIVRELLNGATNRFIAQKLNLSEKTIKYHMTQIMQKFNVDNRLQLAMTVQNLVGDR